MSWKGSGTGCGYGPNKGTNRSQDRTWHFRKSSPGLRIWSMAFRRGIHTETEELGSYKTSPPTYQTTRCHNPMPPIHLPLRKPVKSYILCGTFHELGSKSLASHREGPGSNPRPVNVGFVMDKMENRQVYIRVILFQFLGSKFASLLHTHSLIDHRRCLILVNGCVIK